MMKIRKATHKDKKEYLKTQKEAFPTINSKRDARFFDEKIKKNEIFVAEDKNEYAGHICFGMHKYNPPFAGSVFIEELAVKSKFQGKGIGTMLMKKLVHRCKKNKIQAIYLGTAEDNKAARYYEKQGFRKAGWLEDVNPNAEYDHPQVFYAARVKDWK